MPNHNYNSRGSRWSVLLWILCVSLLTNSSHAQRQGTNEVAPGVLRVGTIEHYALVESSGLERSARYPGVFWTHNDTEDPFLFAMTREGKHIGAYEVQGANLVDWEAMAADAAGWLYFADTGTNGMVRSHSAVHRVEEPDIERSWGAARVVETWFIRFPGEREDCEGFFIHEGFAYLLGKYPREGRVPLYRFSLADESESILLEVVTRLPVDGEVSGADITPDGERLAVVTEEGVTVVYVGGNLAAAARAPKRTVEYESSVMEGGVFVEDGVLVVSEGLPEVLLFSSPFLSGAPVLSTLLEDVQAFVGETVEFSATAVAFPAATYQWYFNGQPIEGQTGAVLTLTNVTLEDAGIYELVASNPYGEMRTSAELSVSLVTVDVRITEVMSSQAPNTLTTEDWWELTSFDTRTNDLSGWRFNESTGNLADAFVLPEGLTIRPGESIIFVENLTPEEFRAWWGEENIPADVQIVTFAGAELSFSSLGDSVRLWDQEATDVNDLAARVEFGTAQTGVTFTYDPVTEVFGPLSQVGVAGAFRAANGGDIGSPGIFVFPEATALAIEARVAGENLEIRFSGEPGPGYILEVTEDLDSGAWTATGEIFQESQVTSILLDRTKTGDGKFYRLRRE